jgi:hypothetical protein
MAGMKTKYMSKGTGMKTKYMSKGSGMKSKYMSKGTSAMGGPKIPGSPRTLNRRFGTKAKKK